MDIFCSREVGTHGDIVGAVGLHTGEGDENSEICRRDALETNEDRLRKVYISSASHCGA